MCMIFEISEPSKNYCVFKILKLIFKLNQLINE